MARAVCCMVVACIFLVQCVYSAKFDAENRRLILDINDQKTTNQQYYSSNFDTSK
ncbi:uncharacterized protein frm isoform X7 [Drosophila pseudoobscura]|uniref:Uncharacterized protein frm isoform X7 n=1 Tax=Drosophila pseudoobscura pseudoobscura TaxID=46245 RepID=A0A6I8W8C3_DROPS|nr:uncharacterized protein LOC4813683 isoform X7 [Drosophila pseudoobscura]